MTEDTNRHIKLAADALISAAQDSLETSRFFDAKERLLKAIEIIELAKSTGTSSKKRKAKPEAKPAKLGSVAIAQGRAGQSLDGG